MARKRLWRPLCSATAPETVLPALGAVSVTVDGAVSRGTLLATVTIRFVDMTTLPALSYARAATAMFCSDIVVLSQVAVNGCLAYVASCRFGPKRSRRRWMCGNRDHLRGYVGHAPASDSVAVASQRGRGTRAETLPRDRPHVAVAGPDHVDALSGLSGARIAGTDQLFRLRAIATVPRCQQLGLVLPVG